MTDNAVTIGRPSNYSPEIAAELCTRLSSGRSLLSIVEDNDMPDRTSVMRWLAAHESFRVEYARAREEWADMEFERLTQIMDTPQEGIKTEEGINDKGLPYSKTIRADMIEHRRLQIDTRKWILARMNPKKYGDVPLVQINNDVLMVSVPAVGLPAAPARVIDVPSEPKS